MCRFVAHNKLGIRSLSMIILKQEGAVKQEKSHVPTWDSTFLCFAAARAENLAFKAQLSKVQRSDHAGVHRKKLSSI